MTRTIPTYPPDDHGMHFLISRDGRHKAVHKRQEAYGGVFTLFAEDGSGWTTQEAFVRQHPDWLPMQELIVRVEP